MIQRWAIDVGITQDYLDAGIEDGYMHWSNTEIASCFGEITGRIIGAIYQQEKKMLDVVCLHFLGWQLQLTHSS